MKYTEHEMCMTVDGTEMLVCPHTVPIVGVWK